MIFVTSERIRGRDATVYFKIPMLSGAVDTTLTTPTSKVFCNGREYAGPTVRVEVAATGLCSCIIPASRLRWEWAVFSATSATANSAEYVERIRLVGADADSIVSRIRELEREI